MSDKQSVTFRAPAELVDALKTLAERNQRSLSGEVVWALTRYVGSNPRMMEIRDGKQGPWLGHLSLLDSINEAMGGDNPVGFYGKRSEESEAPHDPS